LHGCLASPWLSWLPTSSEAYPRDLYASLGGYSDPKILKLRVDEARRMDALVIVRIGQSRRITVRMAGTTRASQRLRPAGAIVERRCRIPRAAPAPSCPASRVIPAGGTIGAHRQVSTSRADTGTRCPHEVVSTVRLLVQPLAGVRRHAGRKTVACPRATPCELSVPITFVAGLMDTRKGDIRRRVYPTIVMMSAAGLRLKAHGRNRTLQRLV